MIFTVRNEVAKAMFLHVSVILSTGGRVCLSACWDTTTTTPQNRHPPGAGTPPQQAPPPDGYCCRWYASYWNAFLYAIFIARKQSFGQGNIFRSVCQEFCLGGVLSQHALQVASQHALQQVSRGVVSQHALQVSRPTPKGGSLGGSGQGGSPGPHPRGKLRGI